MRLSEAPIANGDILLFEGRSWFAFGIKLRTRSQFSHAGVALWVNVDGTSRLCILEALEPWGVRLYPLDRYLDHCHRKGERVHLYRLHESINRDKVAGFTLQQWGKRYASVWQFVLSWGRVTRFFRWLFGRPLNVDTDPERFFCSELVAEALRAGGYVPSVEDDLAPCMTDPGAVALFPCLQRLGVLTP
ncbi:MAG: YiiX/YebB-like N1pC/P60 family cysteine hydrolase [Pirellulaceae bacterium]